MVGIGEIFDPRFVFDECWSGLSAPQEPRWPARTPFGRTSLSADYLGEVIDSGGVTVVVTKYASESVAALDIAFETPYLRARFDEAISQPLMISFRVIMVREFLKRRSQ